ncbi:Signal peptidase I [Bacillus mycoides]|uniref:Signal peptidase I n=3 Tax=Bacillus cereus group TaxID=86661 RepID=A0AAP7WEX6_BACMY|nr:MULTISPECIES: signal peptidase I [Bacillus]EOO39240.1 signal peptidase I [Bacillus mycoides]EOP40722.1 signal peptidase I [Bacillus cereus VD146]ETT83505.1 signal peptidase I [Bacillus mycoides FSL H7-687]KMQ20814.1 signal peptidase [Bacillus mycoides]KUH42421.1 Signal peptidase I [Bacillus mycoides]
MKQLILKDWRKICSYILIIIGIIFINKLFLFCMVEGISMQPTLNENNRILVNRASIYFSSFHHGDVVIIKKEDSPTYYVKRIIGLPGNNIQLRDDEVYINGKKRDESYIQLDMSQVSNRFSNCREMKVPTHKLFVLGDNRNHSKDSRNTLGLIDESNIIGKVKMVYYPFDQIKWIK